MEKLEESNIIKDDDKIKNFNSNIERIVSNLVRDNLNVKEIESLNNLIESFFKFKKFFTVVIYNNRNSGIKEYSVYDRNSERGLLSEIALIQIFNYSELIEDLEEYLKNKNVSDKEPINDILDFEFNNKVGFALFLNYDYIFNRAKNAFTVKEIVFIILHEIGHIINLKIYLNVLRKYYTYKINRNFFFKAINNIYDIFNLDFRDIYKKYFKNKKDETVEYFYSEAGADFLPIQFGYGKVASEFYKKLEAITGNSDSYFRSRKVFLNDILKNEISQETNPSRIKYIENVLKKL